MKNVLNFNPTEQLEIIAAAEQAGEDLQEQMTSSFDSLIFLGKSLKNGDTEFEEMTIFNIRLCYMYFHQKEDYRKVGKLMDLARILESDEVSVVSNEIKDGVAINLN